MEAKETVIPALKCLSRSSRLTFSSAMLFGLLAHGMGLWNKLSWHDDIVSLFWEGSTISSGRWMLHVLAWLEKLVIGDGHFSLPVMNGLFSLLCIGVAAGMLVHLLKIQRTICCVGLGCLMVAFPTVAGLFGYMFTVQDYMLAMTMTVGSAYLICSGKRWWMKPVAVLLGGCAMGIYQAFIPMQLSILLLWDLSWLAERQEKKTVFLKLTLVQILCILGTVGFYFAMNGFFLQKFQLQTNSYMGMDQMGSIPLTEYLARVGTAYREFFRPTRLTSADMYPMHTYYLYLTMLCGDFLLCVGQGICLWQKDKAKALLFFLMVTLIPLACNFVFVMSERVHGLMTYSLVMQVCFFVWLVDRADFRKCFRKESLMQFLRRTLSGAAAGILGLTSIMYARFDNECYLKAIFQQNQAICFFTTLASQIKSVPGFQDEIPVVFLNEGAISDQTLYNINQLDFIHLDPYGETIQGYVNSYSWRAFMERWCGFGPAWTDPTDYVDLPEVKAMPHYPDDGSILRMGDVILVNF